MKDLLNQRRKEFEEKFGETKDRHSDGYDLHFCRNTSENCWDMKDARSDLLSFHDQSIKLVLEKVREEVENMYFDGGLESLGEEISRNDLVVRANNAAINKVLSLLSEIKEKEI